MKLKKLLIDGFKNLNNFEIDFTDKDGITVLIGNNGSGKSNILEAISAIFANLYKHKTFDTRKWDFNYRVEYKINDKNILIEYNKDKNYFSMTDSYGIELSDNNDISVFLPNTCYMIYNGEDQRIKRKYYNPFLLKFRESRRADNTDNVLLPKMIYIDSFFWNISLIALLKSNNEIHKKFCQNILKNNDLTSIVLKFTFNDKYTSPIYDEFLFNLFGRLELGLEEELSYEILKKSTQSEKYIFTTLLSMIGTNNNKVKKLIIESNGINTIYLSEGEKKQILLKSIISVMAKENDLLLMDEVDSSIHVGNKIKIRDMLKRSNVGKTIITTHSPSLTHSFEEKHINMVSDGKIENKAKQDIFSHISDGMWNYQEQSIFLSSTKNIILLVEGKHDKVHIEEAFKRLKDGYSSLDFDVFNMHGVYNITNFMNSMKKSFDIFDETKKYIGIFDYDDAGRNAIFNNPSKKKYTSLKGNKNFYHLYLPFKNEKEDFEIENMYSQDIVKDAYKKAIDEISVINKHKIEDKAKTILSDTCHSFENDDFEYFKELFELIKKIKDIPI
jgi:recombinational DNA repair ATPase RecF